VTIKRLQPVCVRGMRGVRVCLRARARSEKRDGEKNVSVCLFAMLPVALACRVSLINLRVDNVLNYFIL